jgi:hypothetical protein
VSTFYYSAGGVVSLHKGVLCCPRPINAAGAGFKAGNSTFPIPACGLLGSSDSAVRLIATPRGKGGVEWRLPRIEMYVVYEQAPWNGNEQHYSGWLLTINTSVTRALYTSSRGLTSPTMHAASESSEKHQGSEPPAQIEQVSEPEQNLVYDMDHFNPKLHWRTWVAFGSICLFQVVAIVALQGPPAVVRMSSPSKSMRVQHAPVCENCSSDCQVKALISGSSPA